MDLYFRPLNNTSSFTIYLPILMIASGKSKFSYSVLHVFVGRWYAEGLRDVEESVPMRDKTCEMLP